MKAKRLLLKLFLEYQKGYGLAEGTVKRSDYLVSKFLAWFGGEDVREVSRRHIVEYKEELGKGGLKANSIGVVMSILNGFFIFLLNSEYILKNPLEGMRIKEPGGQKLRAIFSKEDINLLLDSIPLFRPVGQRDRALFELMYAAGLRSADVRKLECEHLNLEERVALIKSSKGKKDRYVPFSTTALKFLLKYLAEGRKEQLKALNEEEQKRFVFLAVPGGGCLSHYQLTQRFKDYLKQCALDKKGYCLHSIRHATASHLLESGASIRYVQELLGHEDLKTTQLYARPSEEHIKRVYRTFHPRENEYYKEVDEKYLAELKSLKERLIWGAKASEQYRLKGHKRGFGRWQG